MSTSVKMLMAVMLGMCARSMALQRLKTSSASERLQCTGRLQCLSDAGAQWEEKLALVESKELYGLGSKEVELDQVITWLRKDKLNLFPEYQRDFVWKPERASRLVVTVLCNRLMPAVILHEKKKGCFEVVDGKQRLCSLLTWYLTSADPALLYKKALPAFERLSKLEEDYEDLDGLSFSDLTETRKKAYENYSITYTIIPHSTHTADVFEVYGDINSGGEHLTNQQVRRAVYYGPYIKMLDELCQNRDFQVIYSPLTAGALYKPDSKEADRELILRAFAFKRSYGKFKAPMKKFLNSELEEFNALNKADNDRDSSNRSSGGGGGGGGGGGDGGGKHMEIKPKHLEIKQQELDAQRVEFQEVMATVRAGFREGAFRKWEEGKPGQWGWGKKVSPVVWDVMYSVVAELLVEGYRLREFTQCGALQGVVKDLCVAGVVAAYTPKPANFIKLRNAFGQPMREALRLRRLSDSDSIDSVLGSERRAFSPSLRRPLFDQQQGLCAHCEQSIDESRLEEGDYVHIDHIKPFSAGGKTEQGNAQLTHRVCNQEKGARWNDSRM